MSKAVGAAIAFGTGFIGFFVIGGISQSLDPGSELVRFDTAAHVFEIPRFNEKGQQVNDDIGQALANANKVDTKIIQTDFTWRRVRRGIAIFPGVRSAFPETSYLSVTGAPVRVAQTITATTKSGAEFQMVVSYNAEILSREDAQKFILKNLRGLNPKTAHLEISIQDGMMSRATNELREILSPKGQQYTLAVGEVAEGETAKDLGSNKLTLVNEVFDDFKVRMFEKYGVTITDASFGGMNLGTHQAKINQAAVTTLSIETNLIREKAESSRAQAILKEQEAYNTGNISSGEAYLKQKQLERSEQLLMLTKEAIEKEGGAAKIGIPSFLIDENTQIQVR